MTVLRCTLQMLLWGSVCENVLHFTGPAFSDVLLENMALAIRTGWIPSIKPAVASQVTFFQTKVDDITDGGTGSTRTDTYSIAGTSGSDDAVAPSIAFVLQLESGLAGRKNHGRIFVPGVRPTGLFHGIVSPDATAMWTTPLSNLNLNFNSTGVSDFHLCIHTRGGPTDAVRPVTHIQLRSTIGSMRTRNVGIGM